MEFDNLSYEEIVHDYSIEINGELINYKANGANFTENAEVIHLMGPKHKNFRPQYTSRLLIPGEAVYVVSDGNRVFGHIVEANINVPKWEAATVHMLEPIVEYPQIQNIEEPIPTGIELVDELEALL